MAEILVEKPQAHVALIRINRPEVKNALNIRARELLAEHFTALGADDEVRCIVLTGNEEAFAFLAMRSLAGLALSLPTTTGVAAPTGGGKFFDSKRRC